jgi:hypothetical protein
MHVTRCMNSATDSTTASTRWRHGECRTGGHQSRLLARRREQAVVTDTLESGRQDVLQKAVDELGSRHAQRALLAAGGIGADTQEHVVALNAEDTFHPHVHLVVPAAAVDAATRAGDASGAARTAPTCSTRRRWPRSFGRRCWRRSRRPAFACRRRYPRQWVAHCQSVGSGEKALIYLGRYLYRGVIREQDILACENGRVSFRYRNAQTGKSERRTLTGVDFLWLILQHVLPKGFRRARNFGFLHANCKRLIALLHLLLKFDPSRFKPARKERPAMLCACCGAVMAIVRTRIRATSSAVVPDFSRVGVAI